ncbi:LOW QUALITY PROTEIN: DNA repair and recombination protein RAD54B [Boleophthalmus pectinirostris]|uniref:LOW QUALITY PROTEIN: DNA repair and recombination protein RAD54B n=1 Tax=Boleophthalmus pectinirostris TaxID=150288 RepID=UPI00242AB99A|nr:LOW QUALITY PROTEIN: DNA repair and recombination protein RAD54B [Boleophthalmus pectinirostris]
MRRSGAPSQLLSNPVKKPRFVPPAASGSNFSYPKPFTPKQGVNVLDKIQRSLTPDGPSKDALSKDAPVAMPLSRALARVLSATESKENDVFENPDTPEHSEGPDGAVNDAQTPAADPRTACAQDGVRYFSVMWCKASKKKHKRWEGDAVLVTRGRTATLKDMEGKDIGKGSGYKVSELATLCEGQTLMIGGKEVEVMGVISAKNFARGRCFQDVQVEIDQPRPAPPSARGFASKPFAPPNRAGHVPPKPEEEHTCKPRHDPLAPGALVMPRPSPSHQWSNNKSGLPVVDVVVDPHLTTHLRPHQRDGILFLYECVMGMRAAGRFGAILADEMGLGKTLQSVALTWTLLKQGPYGGKAMAKRTLVVTPGSLVQNWGAEFNKWLGRERISVFTVDQDHRIEQFLTSPLHNVLVISYEMLLRCLEQVQKVEFGLMICDEGHRLKNSTIKTSSALSSLCCQRRVILTGTPVQNDLQEFYAIIDFVNPGILGSSNAYRKVYEEPILRSRQPSCTEEERVLGEERAAELSRLTGMFILRRTQEIINRYLPPRLDWTLFCSPSPLQHDLYRHLLCHRVFRSCIMDNAQTHTHLACITALKKLCNHPGLLYNTVKQKTHSESVESSIYEGLADLFPESYTSVGLNISDSGKLQVLSDLLAAIRQISPSDRVVVVSNYTQTLDMLEELCTFMDYTFCRLDGQTPTNQRQRLVDSFNSPYSQNFLFLLSSKAGGVGLNLIGASHLVLYDIDWNPANDIQAMARVWRDGQRKTVHIYRLLTAGTLEERIFQRQVSKQGLSGTVVDLGKGSEHTTFSTSELRDLFSLTDSQCLTHDLLSCTCSMDGVVNVAEVEEEQVMERPCQLGRRGERPTAAAPQKNLSMSELMRWRHFSGETHSFSDPYLDQAREHITFAFQTTLSHMTQ